MIYFIQAGEDGPVKIGWTSGESVTHRLGILQSANPADLRVIGTLGLPKMYEPILHAHFRDELVRGEWFHPSERILALAAGDTSVLPKAPRQAIECTAHPAQIADLKVIQGMLEDGHDIATIAQALRISIKKTEDHIHYMHRLGWLDTHKLLPWGLDTPGPQSPLQEVLNRA